MSAEECRDTYVTTCTPENTPQPLPECEEGWEFTNGGEPVCATQVPSDLAVTGGDVPVEPFLAGALLLVAGAAILTRRWWTRG